MLLLITSWYKDRNLDKLTKLKRQGAEEKVRSFGEPISVNPTETKSPQTRFFIGCGLAVYGGTNIKTFAVPAFLKINGLIEIRPF
ncbi:hypothetical protein ASF92_00680 [Pedobacter sp. Leaf176]|nr:hypothetical protein ASF92_00680 [Pedobacter sp. Leaf176]